MKKPKRAGYKWLSGVMLVLVLAWAGTRVYNKTLTLPDNPVLRVVDGDTLVLKSGKRLRLLGVNTPEHGEAVADQAKAFVQRFVRDKGIRIRSLGKQDYYHRLLGDVIKHGKSLCQALVEKGLAHVMLIPPYDHARGRRLLAAQDRARSKKLGIWAMPRYAHELHITMFKTRRKKRRGSGYLRVANISAGQVNMGDFLISNGKRMLRLPNCTVPKGETVIIRAARGRNRCKPGKKLSISLGDTGFFGKGKDRVILLRANSGHEIIDKVRARGL